MTSKTKEIREAIDAMLVADSVALGQVLMVLLDLVAELERIEQKENERP